MLIAIAAALIAATSTQAVSDTIFLEVGARQVDGRIFKPHAARVRVYTGDRLTADWVNELTVGDSAGRPVMRWVTTSQPIDGMPNRPIMVLKQTYDGITMAPLGYSMKSSTGAFIQLSVTDKRVVGTRWTGNDTTVQNVDITLPRIGFIASASDLVPVAAGLKTGDVIVAPVWGPNMKAAEDRIFSTLGDTVVNVEGTPQKSRKVEERRRAGGALLATWYLTLESPYMVYGEVPLANGQVQRMTEVPVAPSSPR